MFKAWIIIRRYASVWHVLIMLIFIQVLNPWGSCLCLHSVHCVSSNSALLRQHKYFKCLPAYKSSKLNRVLWQVLSPLLPELIGTTVIYIYIYILWNCFAAHWTETLIQSKMEMMGLGYILWGSFPKRDVRTLNLISRKDYMISYPDLAECRCVLS